MSDAEPTEEEKLLARIALARRLLAEKRLPPAQYAPLPPGPRALHDDLLSCRKCARSIRRGTRYALVHRDGRRLRYHVPCLPEKKEE